MNEESRIKMQGTVADFERFVNAMKSEGLEVVLEAAIPVDLQGCEFDFTVIQLVAILRLSEALANLLQVSPQSVHQSFLSAASHESTKLSQEDKLAIFNHFYASR